MANNEISPVLTIVRDRMIEVLKLIEELLEDEGEDNDHDDS